MTSSRSQSYLVFSKTNQSQTIVKVIKIDSIQDCWNRGKRTQYRMELNSEYSMNKWKFIAKKQGEGQRIKNY